MPLLEICWHKKDPRRDDMKKWVVATAVRRYNYVDIDTVVFS
jgi:hypothetical protein